MSKEWLASKGVKPKCSQCGGASFEEYTHLGLVRASERIRRDNRSTRPFMFGTLTLICTNCGHVLLFSRHA
jgi:hypothetical protein